MDNGKKYFAFISYKREDEKWAVWLQNKLEHYKLPSNLNGRTDLPKEIRPVFRDQSELAGGVLADEIQKALEASNYLIVICSPRAAQSQWVGKEVQSFIDMGRTDKIIPFIIGGTAHAQNPEEECFPSSLWNLPAEQELLGINIDEMGRDAAAVKVVAQMFGIGFDTLWQRYERDKRRKRRWAVAGIVAFAMAALAVVFWMWHQNRKIQMNQARYVAEKAQGLIEGDSHLASLLAINVLPKRLSLPIDFPYTKEAEMLLRKSTISGNTVFNGHLNDVSAIAVSHDGRLMASSSEDLTIRIWDAYSGCCIDTLMSYDEDVDGICFSPEGYLLSSSIFDESIRMWDPETWRCIDSVCGFNAVFNPDGDKMAFAYYCRDENGYWNSIIKVVFADVKRGKIQCYDTLVIKGDPPVMYFNRKNDRFLTVFRDSFRIWDLSQGRCLAYIKGDGARFNYDGNLVLSHKPSDSLGGSVCIWDANDGKFVEEILPPGDGYYTVCIGSDGKHVVFDGADRLHLMDIETKKFKQIELPDVADDFEVFDLEWDVSDFNSDGNLLAVSCAYGDRWDEKRHDICIWDIQKSQCIKILHGHSKDIDNICFMSDGKHIVSCSQDNTVRVWNIEKETLVGTLIDFKEGIDSVAYDQENGIILSWSKDDKTQLWDAGTGDLIRSFDGRGGLSENHKLFYAQSDEGITIWDVENGALKETLYDYSGSRFYCNNNYIITQKKGNKVCIVDANKGEVIHVFDVPNSDGKDIGFLFNTNYKRLVLRDKNDSYLFDLETGSQLAVLKGNECVVFSPNCKTLLSAHVPSAVFDNFDISMWSSITGDSITSFKGYNAISGTSGNRVAVYVLSDSIINGIRSVRLWIDLYDATTGKPVASLADKEGKIREGRFNAKGNRFVTNGSVVSLWDANDGRLLGNYKNGSALFSPDGDYLAVIVPEENLKSPQQKETTSYLKSMGLYRGAYHENYNVIFVVDALTGKELYTIEGDEIMFSPDGRRLVSHVSLKSSFMSTAALLDENDVNNHVYLFDTKTRTVLNAVRGYRAEFSPDGKLLITESRYGEFVNIYDVEKGMLVYDDIPTPEFTKVLFGQDGAKVFFLDNMSRSSKLYQMSIPPLQDLIDETRERFKDRPLTPEERHQYYLE